MDRTDRKSGIFEGIFLPHFHLLIYGIPEAEFVEFRVWLSKSWYEIVGSNDEKHLRAGTRVEQIRSHNGVMRYVSKSMSQVVMAGELGKDTQTDQEFVGRWWGVKGTNNIPWGIAWDVVLTDQEAIVLLRIFRKLASLHGRSFHSLSVFLDASFWKERLPELLHPDFYWEPGKLRSPIFARKKPQEATEKAE